MKMMKRIIMLALLLSASVALAESTPYNHEIDQHKTLLTRVKGKIFSEAKQLDKDKQLIKKTEQALRESESKLSSLTESVRKNQDKRKKIRRRLTTLEKDQRFLKRKLANQQKGLAQQIKLAYLIGPQPYVKILLNQEHPRTVSRMLTYYEYFHKERLRQINEIQDNMRTLNKKQQLIAKERENINWVDRSLRAKKRKLVIALTQRQKAMKNIHSELANKQAYLDRLYNDEKKLHGVIAELEDSKVQYLRDPVALSKRKGKLKWPVFGALAHHFGEAVEGKLHFNGVVINAGEGDPVHVIASGKVIYSGWLRGFGFLIIVNHGHGYLTLYGRNQTLLKKVGEKVRGGEIIARVGSTGGFMNSGLYFELRGNGRPLDPERWCSNKA